MGKYRDTGGSTSSSLLSRVASPTTAALPACLHPSVATAVLPQPCKFAGRLEFHPWHPALCLHHLTGISVKAYEESPHAEIRPLLRLQCQAWLSGPTARSGGKRTRPIRVSAGTSKINPSARSSAEPRVTHTPEG